MIQIDMEMPSGCWNCKFKIKPKGCEFASHYDCLITKKTSAYKDPCNGENHDKIDCPLKEVPTGKWIPHIGMNHQCSVCGAFFPLNEFKGRPFHVNYCIECGAKMVEPQESENP